MRFRRISTCAYISVPDCVGAIPLWLPRLSSQMDETKRKSMPYAMTEDILDYRITRMSADECVHRILDNISIGVKGNYLVCANPHSLEVARTDRTFQKAILQADLVVPDGAGIIIASKLLGGAIRTRVTGMDIFLGLHRKLDAIGGYRVFFLGATAATLTRIQERMKRDFPNITVAGAHSPPFKAEFSPEDTQVMIDTVNRSRPHVVWVGMSAPKQEKWIHQNRNRLDTAFIGAVGAVFDFYTGNIRRSSPWFQAHGLEWLPRLLNEPTRLWKRSFLSMPKFLVRILGRAYF